MPYDRHNVLVNTAPTMGADRVRRMKKGAGAQSHRPLSRSELVHAQRARVSLT